MQEFISPKPFTTAEQVREYLLRDRDRIQCLLCGEWFKSLGKHLNTAHGTELGDNPRNEYHMMFRIPHGCALVCAALSEHRSKLERDRAAGDPDHAARRAVNMVTGRENSYRARYGMRPRRSPLWGDLAEHRYRKLKTREQRLAYLRELGEQAA